MHLGLTRAGPHEPRRTRTHGLGLDFRRTLAPRRSSEFTRATGDPAASSPSSSSSRHAPSSPSGRRQLRVLARAAPCEERGFGGSTRGRSVGSDALTRAAPAARARELGVGGSGPPAARRVEGERGSGLSTPKGERTNLRPRAACGAPVPAPEVRISLSPPIFLSHEPNSG